MKQLLTILFMSFFLFSCEEKVDTSLSYIEKNNEKVFNAISKKWDFVFPQNSSEIKVMTENWNHWQQFKNELQQKPKTSLLAFQMKIKNVSTKTDSLSLTVPESYNNPQVRSRLTTLTTKIKALETFMTLQEIPEKRVLNLIDEINEEITGVYAQWNEIIIKKAIPREIGEDDMIKALDTTRMATQKFLEQNTLEKEEEQQNQEN